MRTLKKSFSLFCALALLAFASLAQAAPLERVDAVSNSDFDQTAKRLETALRGRGMMIVATIDHQNMMRMVGVRIRGSKIFEFGKPDMGKMTIVQHPESGLEIPARIYVWERADGKTVVSYYRVAAVFAAYGKDNLKMAGQMMEKILGEVAAEAAK